MEVITLTSSFIRGLGVDTAIFNTLRKLYEINVDIQLKLLCNKAESLDKDGFPANIPVIVANWPEILGSNHASSLWLSRYIENKDNQIIHIHHPLATYSVKNKKGGKMITWHGNNTLNWNDASFGPWPQRVVRKYLLDNATRSLKHLDYIVTISDFLRNELIDRYHINKKKVTKIYWGVDTDIFSPSDMDEEFMLFVGRLVNYKNIAVLIDLAKHLNFKLVCVGNGSDRTNLETYSKQINAPVEFMGRVPLNKLVDIYQKCSFYVTASKWEGFGLPILESGACSKPAIVPNNTAHVEIVRQGETGFIYENDQHLYRIASNLIEHRGLRKEVGAKASERIYKNFNILETAYGYLDIYNRLLNK